MKPDQVLHLYNKQYASTYNNKFLFSDLAEEDTKFELQTLAKLLNSQGPWLDVACGTGYFLSKFPHIERSGLDLSLDMLKIAENDNPGILFHKRDFRDEVPEWEGKWSLVSCMWYAYGLVESMNEVKQLIKNIATWTSETGVCFLPLSDPELVAGVTLPYEVFDSPWPGKVRITGVLWSYIESPSECHEHMIAPQVQYMIELFEEYFSQVDMVEYPSGRRAIIAQKKIG